MDSLRIARQTDRRLTYSFILPRPKRMPKGYPENPQTFGDYLRKYRMDKGFFAEDLAYIIGVTEQTILNWEQGRVKRMRRIYAERLSSILPEFVYNSPYFI